MPAPKDIFTGNNDPSLHKSHTNIPLLPSASQGEMLMIDLVLGMASLYVWRYNGAMQIVNFPENQYNQVGASGLCPHCDHQSYFQPIATSIDQSAPPIVRCVSATKCQSCKGYLLVVGLRNPQQGGLSFALESVYPLGKPNDTVAEEVVQAAKGVADDFAEALRCQWIKAYRACVVMCRRALQSSAIQLKANGGRLIDQIDNLAASGIITGALREFAHEVRLTGNDGAHPDKDGLEDVTEKDAADIVEFTREYLHHVYVMPAKLKARRPPAPVPAP